MTDQKFNDERINAECGRIYRLGILYATLVALVYGILHFIQLDGIIGTFSDKARTLTNFYIFLLPEATVFFSGLLILVIGQVLHGRTHDERDVFERHGYYLTAAKTFVCLAFLGYELTVPFSTQQWSNDVPLNYLVKLFETLGVIYLYYAFKKRDLFFNYSFIHERKSLYYKRVFLNIAKLAGILFLGFFGAALLDLGLHSSLLNFWAILIAYLLSVVSLGLEYLFISWTEKLSYDEQGQRGLHIGTFIQFIFLLANTFVAFSVMILLLQVTDGALGEALIEGGFHLGEIMTEIIYVRNHLADVSSVLAAMMLCKFMCQIRDCKTGRKAIGGIILLTSLSFLWGYISTFTVSIIQQPGVEAESLLSNYVYISNVISTIESLINAILWTVLITDLVKTAKLPPYLWIVAGIRWFLTIMGTLSSFMGHRGLTVFYSVSGGILGFASLLLLLILLHRHQYPHEHEEYL